MLTTLSVLAGLYAMLVLLGCIGYRSLLYPAPRGAAPEPPAGAEVRDLRADDGVRVQTVYFPAPEGAPTIVHFHGNGESLRSVVPFGAALARRGVGVLLVEYRGYGSVAGAPTEEGLYLDAKAALDALEAEGVPRQQIVLSGTSLGTGVAADMAARGRGAALVLTSPYTSIPRLAGRIVPFLPTGLIVSDKFDTLGKTAKIHVPVLVIHGDADEVVPYDMGREVASRLDAKFITVQGGHHNDLLALRGGELMDAIVAHAKQASAAR